MPGLRRFQRHSLFQEIEAAEKRLHELPYCYHHNGETETGSIDLLYHRGGKWTLVDFKTDRVKDEAAWQRVLAEKDYTKQVRQYGTAVERLLDVRPVLMLCLLNFAGQVRMITEQLMNP